MENAKTTGYAPVNGLNMYYEIYGSGTMPLALIHGGGSTIETTFSNLLPLFSAHTKVIAVELQAHGRTNDRDAPESFEQDADDVAGLLNHLNINNANILGFSNGGSTAMQIGIRHPEKVNKLVAVSACSKREGLIAGFFDGMRGATLADMPQSLKDAFLKVTPDKNRLQAMFEKDKERMLNFKDWPDDDLRAIKAPTLLIAADQDVITVQHTLGMSKLIPGSRLSILPGNHGSIIGEAGADSDHKLYETTAAIVKAFLSSNTI